MKTGTRRITQGQNAVAADGEHCREQGRRPRAEGEQVVMSWRTLAARLKPFDIHALLKLKLPRASDDARPRHSREGPGDALRQPGDGQNIM